MNDETEVVEVNWGLASAVVGCLFFWLILGIGCFNFGILSSNERWETVLKAQAASLEVAEAKLDRLAPWVEACRITYVYHTPELKLKTAQMVCPDSVALEVEER
jgi:hypothetical protein